MKKIFQILLIILFSLSFLSCAKKSPDRKVTIRVISHTVPQESLVYISGNINELGNWDANKIPLSKLKDGIWERTFSIPENYIIEYKFTLGSWHTEALDSLNRIPINNELTINNDTVLVHSVPKWNQLFKGYSYILSPSLFKENAWHSYYTNGWRFSPHDSIQFASLDYNDTTWKFTESTFPGGKFEEISEDGIGWFRCHFWVDSSLFNKTIAFTIRHIGASEVYFNGKKVLNIGKISKNKERSKVINDLSYHLLTFDSQHHQVMAVKYGSLDRNIFKKYFLDGFTLALINPATVLSIERNYIIRFSGYQIVFTIVPFFLAFIHLIIFFFYPKNFQNLYYSICLIGFSALSFFGYVNITSSNPDLLIMSAFLTPFSISTCILFGLYTAYAASMNKLPKRHYFFLAATILILALSVLFSFNQVGKALYVLYAITIIETIRSFWKSSNIRSLSLWFTLAGFFILVVFIVYQILIELQLTDSPFGNISVYGFGVLGLIIFMSLALSYDFAKTNKDLESQLKTVKKLHDINLEQERKAKEQEISRVLLEADNNRKTEELSQARELQFSMLPKKIPEVDYLDIAVFMRTASEVGGDYYDFHLMDNKLKLAIGDATGHGTKAGTMVVAVKSILNALNLDMTPLQVIKRITHILKGMNLHNLYMSLTVAEIENNNVKVCSAGMPPILLFKAYENQVEKLLQKSMPLGSFVDFPYIEELTELKLNDVLLFMSDGFMEAFNKENNLLGIEAAIQYFQSCGREDAKSIINCLTNKLDEWINETSLKDDVTFVVIKKIK